MAGGVGADVQVSLLVDGRAEASEVVHVCAETVQEYDQRVADLGVVAVWLNDQVLEPLTLMLPRFHPSLWYVDGSVESTVATAGCPNDTGLPTGPAPGAMWATSRPRDRR